MALFLDIKQDVRIFASTRPRLFYPFCAVRKRNRGLIVRKNTQFVIEGYPRSANTFAVLAFQKGESRPVRLGHHLHVPAQIMRAVEWNIPALVLIRDPVDAILSLLVRYPKLSPARCLRDYMIFYESIKHLRNGFVIGKFDDVINRHGEIIESVNRKFGTDFTPFVGTPENIAKVFADINLVHEEIGETAEQIARPTEEKNRLKRKIKDSLETEEILPMVEKARECYKQFIAS
jgi:hypothetical protein